MEKTGSAPGFLRRNRAALLVLLAALVIFIAARAIVAPEKAAPSTAGDYAEYENGRVLEILSDSTERDEASDGAFRGEQMMLVEVTTGQYKGETLQVYNYVGPLYGAPLKTGDRCTMTISTYENGDHTATVYEYDRTVPLIIVVAMFLAVTVLVGGKTGAQSLVGLIFTVLSVFLLLFPALMKGAPTLLTTFAVCVYVAAVSFVILGGVQKKTVCALLGTVAGMAFALIFALIAQGLLRINGLRSADAEPLLQLRQTGAPLGLRGLLAAGVILSALGAVMDVAMSLSSALSEVHAADPALDRRALLRSGMIIGRDMVGTMTNTLILAFLGGGLMLTLYIYTLAPSPHQLLSSAYLANEVMTAISSSIGVILSVPVTALISACAYGKR
ncbi:MAG: YibE/F family protein [Oscillospiraceae bacterium]|nr:YibE/F family protein [Oscillospiraceae bacterium]